MMSSERKIKEGTECIQQAEKFLKTSFLKWKPDFDNAAAEYSKAATCFRTAKAFEQCKDCHLKAADCFSQNQSYFSAAKSIEQAALVYKEMENYREAAKLVERASHLFREHGTPDTAALALEKGAKMVEAKYPEIALDLYIKAADVVMIEDRPRQAAEYSNKASRLLTKLKRFDDAADMLHKTMEYTLASEDYRVAGRLVIAQVLVHLMREDFVAAEKAFKEGNSYMENEEVNTVANILEGYDQGDEEQMRRGLSHPFIKHMDVEYARLARDLQSAQTGVSGLDNYDTPKHQTAGASNQNDVMEDLSSLM